MKLGIVIPAYNEENTIFKVVESVKTYGLVVVANDCSKDRTQELALRAGADVITPDLNMGYDKIVGLGFKRAIELGCTHIITFDADGQHPANRIADFVAAFNEGYCVIVGVRPKMARISETMFDLYFRFRFGVRDPLSGMKGYSADFFKKVGFFDSVGSIGTELLLRAIIFGLKIKEIEIQIQDREDESRFGGAFRANKKITGALFRVHHLATQLKTS